MSLTRKLFAFGKPVESFCDISEHANVFWKDLTGRYLYVNDVLEKQFGVDIQDCVGANDHDLKMSNEVSIWRREDFNTLLLGKPKLFFCKGIALKTGIDYNYLSLKTPLLNSSNHVKGVFGLSFHLDKLWVVNATDKVNMVDFLSPFLSALIPYESGVLADLTKRERECAYHMVQGKTAKEIGCILSISPRTAEGHLDSIKYKLGCQTRSQVISILLADIL